MKNLFIILALTMLFSSCTKMDYSFEYIYDSQNYETTWPGIYVYMTIEEQQAPNTYLWSVNFIADTVIDINSISLKVNYDRDAVTFSDSVYFGENLFYNNWIDTAMLGATFYNIDYETSQVGYSFASIKETKIRKGFIFRQIIHLHSNTELTFSRIPDEFEFTDIDGNKYALEYRYIKFEKR